jgi:hypothetical protein
MAEQLLHQQVVGAEVLTTVRVEMVVLEEAALATTVTVVAVLADIGAQTELLAETAVLEAVN